MNELEEIKDAVKKWEAATENATSALLSKYAAKQQLEKNINYQDCKVIIGKYLFYLDNDGEIISFEKADYVIGSVTDENFWELLA
jgi:hypothetical protein